MVHLARRARKTRVNARGRVVVGVRVRAEVVYMEVEGELEKEGIEKGEKVVSRVRNDRKMIPHDKHFNY